MQGFPMTDAVAGMTFYLFINTMSGNQKGKDLLKLQTKKYAITEAVGTTINLVFVDLFNDQGLRDAMVKLGNIGPNSKQLIRAIICGGDGTLSWVLNQFVKWKINMQVVVFGMLPIGTGNDWSRSLGWNVDQIDFTQENLTGVIKQWIKASIKKYDMWDVTLETFKNGKIYSIKNRKQYAEQSLTLKKMFSNYVGFGLDGRIVYTIERYRTPYAWVNVILYGLMGLVNFFRPMKELSKKISTFVSNNSELQNFSTEDMALRLIKPPVSGKRDGLIYSGSDLQLKGSYKGFVCMNCTSYMTGLRQIWNTTKIAVKQGNNMNFTPNKVDDGKIEFVAYKSELGLALERLRRSGAKLAQGSGPFEIILKKPAKEDISYMQIDGQSIKVKNLKLIRITRTQNIAGHQINVLANE